MRSVVAAAFYTTLGMSMAGLAAILATETVAYTIAVQGIGAETPIEGVTLGWLLVSLGTAIFLLWRGVKSLVALGGYIQQLRQTFDQLIVDVSKLDTLPPRVESLEQLPQHIDELRRWRDDIVNPSLTRQGAIHRKTLGGSG